MSIVLGLNSSRAAISLARTPSIKQRKHLILAGAQQIQGIVGVALWLVLKILLSSNCGET